MGKEKVILMIAVDATISYNGKKYDINNDDFVKDLIQEIKISTVVKTITYVDNVITIKDDVITLNSNDSIDVGKKCNVYFILNMNNDILYVGKSLEIEDRLKQHLIKKPKGTHSKIIQVHKHLNSTKTQSIKYHAIKIEPKNLYGSIEGILISYFKRNKKNTSVSHIWNIKEN